VNFHHPRIDLLLIIVERIPGWDLLRARSQDGTSGSYSEPNLPRQRFLAHLVPALIELSLELGNPVLGSLVRSVTVTRSEIYEEGLAWSSGVLRANPVDGPIRQIVDKNVVRVLEWRQHWCRVLKQRGMPLVGIAAEEAIEIFEAQPPGPLIKGSSRTLHPLWNEVVLAKPR